jgi:hypothetical protein
MSETEEERYERLVAEELAKGDEIIVNDDNCNDGAGNCYWDGVSRRCGCGNRRMYWARDGEGDDMTVYPSVH